MPHGAQESTDASQPRYSQFSDTRPRKSKRSQINHEHHYQQFIVFRKIACLGVRGWARVEHNGTRFVVHSPVLVEREYTGPLDIEVTHDRATMLIKSPPFVIQAAVHSFESMRSTKSSQPSSGEYVNG